MAAFDRSIAAGLAILIAVPPSFLRADEPKPAARDLEAETDALVAEIPVDRYDVAARAASLGAGVEPAFVFVRDRIGFEAYPGVLRGAGITLASEAGNAFDRSLLLAQILAAKSIPTRFALGRLGEKDAQRLFERIFDPPSRPAWVGPPGDAAPRAGEPSLVAPIRARASRDYAAIRKAMGDAFPRGAGSTRAEALKDIAPHAWVQAKVGDAWLDLDTSFPDAVPGKAFTAVEKTVDLLPADVAQSVTIRVVAETLSGGKLATETKLEVTDTAANLLDTLVLVGHAPPDPGVAGALVGGVSGGAETWKPFVWIEGVAHAGKEIVYDEGGGSARGQPPAGGLGRAFGPGGALGSRRELVAEWLEIEVSMPGGRRDVSRRILFDRAGLAWRAGAKDPSALRPLPRAGKTPSTPREVHVLWFTAGRHDMAACAAAFQSLLLPTNAQNSDEALVDDVWPLAVQSAAIAVVSDHLLLPSLDDRPTCRFYADSPRLLLFTAGPNPAPTEGMSQFTVDLPRDSIRGVARTDADESDVAERKVWFGCLQGALEHEFVAGYAKDPDGPPIDVVSTCSLHGDAGLVAVRPGAGSPPIADRERAARVAAVLAKGRTVVAPPAVLAGGTLAWWEVAPDGTTRTVLEEDLASARGRGGSPPGVVPGINPNEETTWPRDWESRKPWRNRGEPSNPGASDPTKPGGPANPNKAPRPGAKPPPPRTATGPLRRPGGGGSSGGGGRSGERAEKKRGGGNEYILIVVVVTVITVALAHLIQYFYRRGTEYIATMIKDIMSGGSIADGRRPRR